MDVDKLIVFELNYKIFVMPYKANTVSTRAMADTSDDYPITSITCQSYPLFEQLTVMVYFNNDSSETCSR